MRMYNHLTRTERSMIEKYLAFGYSFKEIAKTIGRSPTTISREVRNNRCVVAIKKTQCANYYGCGRRKLCGEKVCMQPCKACKLYDCKKLCKNFSGRSCLKLEKSHYCCNCCLTQDSCSREHAYYHAHRAQTKYLRTLSQSRATIQLTQEKTVQLNGMLTPPLKGGQSTAHIFATHKDEISVSRKTIYNIKQSAVLMFEILTCLEKSATKRESRSLQNLCHTNTAKVARMRISKAL